MNQYPRSLSTPLSSDVRYDISATIASDDIATTYTGTADDVYVQMIGTAGHTEELGCPSGTFNLDAGTTVTCTVTSTVEMGDYTCVRWRLDGEDGLKIAEFTTSIDDVTQTTIAPADGWIDSESGAGNNGPTATWCTSTEPTGKILGV